MFDQIAAIVVAIATIVFFCDNCVCFCIEVEQVAFLQNRAGSGYLKNSKTGPGRVPLKMYIIEGWNGVWFSRID